MAGGKQECVSYLQPYLYLYLYLWNIFPIYMHVFSQNVCCFSVDVFVLLLFAKLIGKILHFTSETAKFSLTKRTTLKSCLPSVGKKVCEDGGLSAAGWKWQMWNPQTAQTRLEKCSPETTFPLCDKWYRFHLRLNNNKLWALIAVVTRSRGCTEKKTVC